MVVVNFFGGPGIGKSTYGLALSTHLKERKVLSELVPEFAKQLTWEHRFKELNECQPWISMTQWKDVYIKKDQLDVIVSDSPIITGIMYQHDKQRDAFETLMVELFNEFDNFNILLVRNLKEHPYLEYGRTQSEAEAIELDSEIRTILIKFNIPFIEVEVGPNTIDTILNLMKERYTIKNL